MEDIKRKEKNGEPLEWELELIAKDTETRKLIFDILTQKNDIENYEKQNLTEEILKDKKDLASNPFSALHQHVESEREKQRSKRKLREKERIEKKFLDEEREWLKTELEINKYFKKAQTSKDEIHRRKKRLIERDLNYNSDEEKLWRKQNLSKYNEHKERIKKDIEFDEQIKKREQQDIQGLNKDKVNDNNMQENDITDLVLVENELQVKEPVAKTEIVYKEYEVKETENEAEQKEKITLDFGLKAKKVAKRQEFDVHEIDNNDPFVKRKVENFKFDEEVTKDLENIRNEVNLERKEEQIKKLQKQEIKNIINTNEDSKKLIEIQSIIFAKIPTEREELFSFPIDWRTVYKVNNLKFYLFYLF